MSDRYLWDPHHEPDAEIRDLERALKGMAYQPDLDRFNQNVGGSRRRLPRAWLAVAASVLVAVSAAMVWWSAASSNGWKIVAAGGTVHVGSQIVQGGLLQQGQRLETQADGSAQLEVAALGSVEVQPGSVVRLVRATPREQRMALDRGSIRAIITAPPRLFVVETPAAVAVDLGCAYKLDVDEAGNGYLRVTVGWVSFEAHGRESFIPAGAACRTRKGHAPGTPFYQDASDVLQEALARADFSNDASERTAAREIVLKEARVRDRLTLWHLLSRGSEGERAAAYDRFAELSPLPPGVTRQGVLRLDRAMLDQLWSSIDLGPTLWWRMWKGPAPPSP